ncbi:MAG: ACT domain-containing protein [Nanoarchaeota archaeon]|nr:ACT domain-containing protein [Nanoarchaeota archaeon]
MNLTRLAEKYIQEHPYIRACLRKGLINYSSLTREIALHNKLGLKKNFDAILIACRRYKRKVENDSNEKEILELLKKSRIEAKNKILAVVLEKNISLNNLEIIEKKIRKEGEVLRIAESVSAITMITSEEYSKEIKNTFKSSIITETKGLVEVTLKTSNEIEHIPGVMSFLYMLFAEHKINIVETISCWTDTIFLIKEKDLAKVMGLLRF